MTLAEERELEVVKSGLTYACTDDHSEKQQEQVDTQKAVILPNQLKEVDNKALGLGYTLEDDKLHAMVGINFSKRKMRLGQDLQLEQVRAQTPDPLTR